MEQEFETGFDECGNKYSNIQEMWEKETENKNTLGLKNPVGGLSNWYKKANEYWSKTEATINGVLGGFEQLDDPDNKDSTLFIEELQKNHGQGNQRAIDMGAGIGRVSKNLLCKKFNIVDIVDQCDNYVQEAKNYLKDCNIGHFITSGLQELQLKEKYDCVWIQWVAIYLTDKHFVQYLQNCKQALSPNGVIVVKENHTSKGFIVDKEDYSVTRSEQMYKDLFNQAGLKIIKEEIQKDFPQELFMVKTYALVPQ